MNNIKILIAGGGTGGHLFPALAIGEEIHLRKPSAKIHYVGSTYGLEAKVFPIKDVWHTLLPIRGLQRQFDLKSIGRNSLLPIRILSSLHKINQLMREFLPQLVIGTGGYASALPLLIATRRTNRLPIVLQEQNSYPGVTTRLFAKHAISICTAFNQSENMFGKKLIQTGNPIRKDILNGNKKRGFKEFDLKSNHKTIFLFGGSQGSSYLNKIMNLIAKNISNAGIQVIWQTGDIEFSKYKDLNTDKIKIIPFINNMPDAYAISDLIICRSGALTLAEITVCGKPSILIPYPHAAGDHQTKNAQALVNANASRLHHQKTLEAKDLQHTIINLIHNDNKLKTMSSASKKLGRPNATKDIVDHILEIIL